MTENKRFYLDENGINDREYEFSILGEDELVDIINELNEENEQLKHDATVLICSNQEYREENGKLKEKIKSLNDARLSYKEDWKSASAYCEEYKDGISHLKDDVNGLIEERNELRKENEELKSIKNFAERNGINIFKIDEAFHKCWDDNSKLTEENNELRGLIDLIADIDLTIPRTNVKDLIQDEITSIETVIEDSGEAWNTYCILDNFFKEHYKKKKMG